jgi:uncharacterized membrane protein (DUF373 family)
MCDVRIGGPVVTKLLDRAVYYVEFLVAGLLVIIAALGAVDLIVELVSAVSAKGYLTPQSILRVLDAVLVVFVVIELFSIALAYLQKRNIIATVMEAGLVAVVRKLVVFETGVDANYVLLKSISLGVLILAIGVTWYLLRSSGVCEIGSAHDK